MDMERIKKLLRLYAWPGVLIFVGLILMVSPDTASALISKIIGWVLIGIGVCIAIAAILDGGYGRTGQVVSAVLCLGVGIFISAFPLVLAEMLGRFFGILLTIRGVAAVRGALQKKNADLTWQYSMMIALVTLAIGVILALLPLTLSRIILNLCGLALVVIGVVTVIATRQEQKMLESGRRRPDVIDADE